MSWILFYPSIFFLSSSSSLLWFPSWEMPSIMLEPIKHLLDEEVNLKNNNNKKGLIIHFSLPTQFFSQGGNLLFTSKNLTPREAVCVTFLLIFESHHIAHFSHLWTTGLREISMGALSFCFIFPCPPSLHIPFQRSLLITSHGNRLLS